MNSRTAFVLVGILLFARAAAADPITLTDLNSTFSVNPTTQAGAYSWQVDGTEHLFKEWFWYRVGTIGRERSIDSLQFVGFAGTDTDADASSVLLQYSHSQFTLSILLDLDGGTSGSGAASVNETITISRSPSAIGNIAMNFFSYTDFNLQGTAGNDTATVTNSSMITQTDPTAASSTVTAVNPLADHYQVASGGTLLTSLNDGSTTTLNDTPAVGNSVGPADVAFAFQWQEVIAPGVSYVINQEKSIVGSMAAIPEPGSLLLVATGLVGLQRWRRGRQRVSLASR